MEERLGDRIRAARARYGMPATVLARRADITRQQLYMIETHKTIDPGIKTIERIADVLGVTTDYLLKGERRPRRKADESSESSPTTPALVGAAAESWGVR